MSTSSSVAEEEAEGAAPAGAWVVYVLRGARAGVPERGVYYVGCTTNLARRLRQHNGELAGGARFTRRGRPWAVARVYGPFAGRGEAQRAERAVKALRGARRLEWGE